MSNLSQIKRQHMMEFLNKIKDVIIPRDQSMRRTVFGAW